MQKGFLMWSSSFYLKKNEKIQNFLQKCGSVKFSFNLHFPFRFGFSHIIHVHMGDHRKKQGGWPDNLYEGLFLWDSVLYSAGKITHSYQILPNII